MSWRSEPSARSTIRRAPGGRDVLTYDWRPLTSGSRSFAAWPLLLPFTLANLAGFMGPADRAGAYRLASVLFGLAMTGSTVVWMLVAANAAWSEVDFFDDRANGATWTFWLATASGAIAVGAIVVVATYTARGFERYRSHGWADDDSKWSGLWGASSRRSLDDSGFFDNARDHIVRWRIHAAAAVVVGAASVVAVLIADGTTGGTTTLRSIMSVDEPNSPAQALRTVVAVMAIATAVCVALLVAASMAGPGRRIGWRVAGPATATLASVVLGGAVLSSLIATAGIDAVPVGPVAMFYDVFGWSLLAALLAAVAVTVYGLQTPSAAEVHPGAKMFVPTLISRLRARVAVVPAGMVVAPAAFAATFAVGVAIAVFTRVVRNRDWEAWRLTETLPVEVAQYTMVLLIGFMLLNAVKSWGNPRVLRRVGNVWDVITFWPRTFHPFAVRPYAERAVPELEEFIFGGPEHRAPRPLSVVAHSQGSVLAYAALRPMTAGAGDPRVEAGGLGQLRLVTVGSPLRSLYSVAFPRYVAASALAEMGVDPDGDNVGSSVLDWTNGFRFTDHVGRAVFAADADVAAGTMESHDRAIPERGASIATSGVDGHNHYWTSPEVVELVRHGRRWRDREETR